MLSVCWCSNMVFFVQWRQVSPQVRSHRCSNLWLRLCVFRSFTGINPDRPKVQSWPGQDHLWEDGESCSGEVHLCGSTPLQNLMDSEWKSLQVSEALNRQQLLLHVETSVASVASAQTRSSLFCTLRSNRSNRSVRSNRSNRSYIGGADVCGFSSKISTLCSRPPSWYLNRLIYSHSLCMGLQQNDKQSGESGSACFVPHPTVKQITSDQ